MIYNRRHNNKSLLFNYELIKRLSNLNLKIFVVGDKLNIKKVNNLGYINKKKLAILQSRTKYSISSGENIYSLFVIECVTNHVKIFVNKKQIRKVKILKNFFKTYSNSMINLKKSL